MAPKKSDYTIEQLGPIRCRVSLNGKQIHNGRSLSNTAAFRQIVYDIAIREWKLGLRPCKP